MNMHTLKVTEAQLHTIMNALEEFYDSEENFLRDQIINDPKDTETIIATSVNMHNIVTLRPIISDIISNINAKG